MLIAWTFAAGMAVGFTVTILGMLWLANRDEEYGPEFYCSAKGCYGYPRWVDPSGRWCVRHEFLSRRDHHPDVIPPEQRHIP